MNNAQQTYLGKPLPSSPESERVILGAILLDGDIIFQCIEKNLSPEDFHSPMHGRVYKAMLALFEAGENINPIVIGNEIKKDYSLDAMGGVAAITNLSYGLPVGSDVYDYIRIVKEKSAARKLITICNRITSDALAEETDVASLLDAAEANIYNLRDGKQNGAKPIGALLRKSLEEKIERAKHSQDAYTLTGLSTGFKRLNEVLSGLKKKDLIIVGARPGQGKSAFFMQIAHNATDDDPEAVVLVFSLEMGDDQLTDRSMAQAARIDTHRYQNAYLMSAEKQRMWDEYERLQHRKIFIDDSPSLSVLEMKSKARHLKSKEKRLDLIVIDYLDLVKKPNKQQKHTELKDIACALKATAKELDVPVMLLHQLNRDCEKRMPPKPMISDLREAGEEDADVVLLIYRSEYYAETILAKHKSLIRPGVAEIHVAKNRNGPTAIVDLAFLASYTRFENLQD